MDSVIREFNMTQDGILRIIYKQNGDCYAPDFKNWLFGEKYRKHVWYKKLNISEGNVAEYLLKLYDELGCFDFFKMVANRDVKKHYQLLSCQSIVLKWIVRW